MRQKNTVLFKYFKKQHKNSRENKDRIKRSGHIRVDDKKKILFLREKKWRFEFTKTDIKDFFNKSAYRISMVTIFVMSIVIISLSSTSTANVAQFYAVSCLGGWENPQNAEGAPQIFNGSEEVFGTSTSAILRDSMSEIFCGNFQSDISDDTTIKKAVLKLSWLVDGEFKDVKKDEVASDTEALSEDIDLLNTDDPFLETSSVTATTATTVLDVVDPIDETEDEIVTETSSEEIAEDATTIESDDFISSVQDILDAPSDTSVEFTLTQEETADEIDSGEGETEGSQSGEQTGAVEDTISIESDDFMSSVLDILDAPSDAPVEFTLTPMEEDPVEEPVIDPITEPEPDVEQVPEEAVEDSESDEVSFFKKFFKVVLADEIDTEAGVSIDVSKTATATTPSEDTILIESDDFISSVQDILDAPSDTPVEFTLSPAEEEDADSTTVQSDDFISSVQDILDAPSDTSVEFTLTQEETADIESGEQYDPVDTIQQSTEDLTILSADEPVNVSDDEIVIADDIEIRSAVLNIPVTEGLETDDNRSLEELLQRLANEVAQDNDFLEIEYTFNSVDWQHLGFAGSDNWQDAEFELPVVEWDELEKLQVRIKNLPTIDEQPVVYLDSMWIEVTHYKGKDLRPATLKDLSHKKTFSFNDELKFEFEFQEEEEGMLNDVLDSVKDIFSGRKFSVDKMRLIDAHGKIEKIESFVEYGKNGTVSVVIKPKSRSVKPGKYILEVYVKTKGGEILIKQQDFYLGVLAINVNRSIYLPGERAYLQMAALTDMGHTICDANLWMSITNPDDEETVFSTEDGTIFLSGKCDGDNVTDVPDYFAYYNVGDAGVYTMKLVNLSTGHEIKDSFEVRDEVPFEVERVGPTRIYPPAAYQVTMYVTAMQDFGGDMVEYVPSSFEITDTNLTINNGSTTVSLPENVVVGQSENENETTEIIWSVNIKKGDMCTLDYRFDAPDVSPEFYLLGPLEFYE